VLYSRNNRKPDETEIGCFRK